MRRLPTLIAIVFISLTLSRVADYVDAKFHAGGWSWMFSIGLAAAIFVSAYYTRKTVKDEKTPNRNRRYAAWVSLLFFVGADGYFNLAEVLLVADSMSSWFVVGPWIYGLFPTIAAVLMGTLQGYLDRETNVKEFSFSRFVSGMKASKAGDSLLVQLLEAVTQGSQGEMTGPVPGVQPVSTGSKPKKSDIKKIVTDDELLAVWQKDPKASDAQVADSVGITRSAVQQRRVALQERGVLMKTEQGIVIYSIPNQTSVESAS